MTFVNEFYQRADAFLFVRRTYKLFAGYWGGMADSGNPIKDVHPHTASDSRQE